ncbi:MAC/perforin domain-containing protein [uncultured Mucilaginibacter sp.]|uniref:MAC/perforin domain-containing protein n=1 Tax=uncultured Mucilaginibacter sp. TaxID=797541 RepID=UPI0025E7D9EE|nr:MAC/perforin domain-containing protein [uncultured Mucilaginibacter sp.]
MNKTLFLLGAMALFTACKKTNVSNAENANPENIKDVKFSLSKLAFSPVKQGNGDYNYVGYGYDITGKYADVNSVMEPVFNVPAFAAAYPQRIDVGRSTSGGFRTLYAENADDFLTQMTQRFDKGQTSRLFVKTLTNVYPGDDVLANKYIYAQYDYTVISKTIKAYLIDETAKRYLSAEFRNDVKGLAAKNLVKKYGTHVLSQLSLGAKFNVFYQAKTSDSRKLHSAMVGFTYALNNVFSTLSGYLDDLKAADVNAISEPNLIYEAIGGDAAAIVNKETAKGTVVWFHDWVKTCTNDKAVFVEILPKGLIPLYDLIDDEAKKTEVKNYITSYIEQSHVKS